MNNKQILELTHHLSQALDQNYDVVNMETVLAVISNLEGTTITKEQLETTRLAKYINQLRRRTNNENLARRSKSLLKKWREMVGMQQTAGDTQQQQQQTTTSPVNNASVDNGPPNRQNSQPTSPLAPNSAEQTIETRTAINCTTNVSPTSFSNLINNLSSSNNNNNVQQRVMAGGDYSSSNASLKTKTFLHTPQQQQKRTETFVIDHSSNSNSISNFGSTFVNRAKNDEMPIVIDIDSDSQESENTRLQQQPQQQQQNVARTNIAAMPLIQPVSVSTKVKKAKKEKKRKEKDTQCKVAGGFATISAMSMNDERSSSNTATQLAQKHKNDRSLTMSTTDGDLLINAKERKQHLTNISSMSEILSLSNSSMSSIFASDSGLTSLKNKSTAGVDLTFAGKFKTSQQQMVGNNSANNTSATVTVNGSEALEQNYVSGDSSNAAKETKPTKSFIALTNEDNSTSSSQIFPFDVIDVVSQDNNQTKMIEELRSQSNAALQQIGSIGNELFDSNRNDAGAHNRDRDRDGAATINAKMPKKRGRKKGSKGVDSIIAQETSLSQQIFGSGGKKVKTTKELFNEIQNRKLGLTAVSSSNSGGGVTQKPNLMHTTAAARQSNTKLHGIQNSRPASSCSEPSLHSPRTMDAYLTNATVSTGGATRSSTDNVSNPVEDGLDSESDTMTSEHSRDGNKQSKPHRTTSVDSNSSSQFEPTAAILNSTKRSNKPISSSSNAATKTDISGAEAQLREIVQRLPLPAPTQIVEEEYTAELVPCTCVLIEELPKVETVDEATLESGEGGDTKPLVGNGGGVLSDSMTGMAGTNVQNQKVHDDQQTNASKSSVQDMATVVQTIVQKPKKSIFDLDFDEDDDPLKSLIAEAAVAAEPSTTTDAAHCAGNIKSEQLNEMIDEGLPTTLLQQEHNGAADNTEQMLVPAPPLHLYRVEEDGNCMAKQRYDLQTNQITNFHIDALHNCYIPNVNGNWDDATLPTTTLMHYYDVTDGGDVVPQYGCLINERIPKDLSQLSFCKEVKTIRAKFQNMPFLGVAKCLPSCRKQKRTLRRIATKQPPTPALPNDGQHADVAIKVEHVEEDICKKETTERLEINVGVGEGVGVSAAYALTNQQQQHEVIRSDDGSDFTSHGLLAIANSREPPTQLKPNFSADDDDELVKAEELTSRRSSSCSNSSLQKTQNSINEKLRRHQQSIKNMNYSAADSNVAKRKRKKRKKLSSRRENGVDGAEVVKQRKIKRIRIAINGDIATQRQISLVSSSNNNSSTDDDNDDDDDKDHVDCHNIMSSDSGDEQEDSEINYRNVVADGDENNDSDSYKAEVEGGGGSDIEVESVQSMATVESVMPDDEAALDVDVYNDYDMMPICSNIADEYAIVQRPMPETGTNTNHHIVLTIKKTPSKTNSPANSLSAISPVIPTLNGVSNANDDNVVGQSSPVSHNEMASEHKPTTTTVNGYANSDNKMTEIVLPECRFKPTDIQLRLRRRRRRLRRKSRVPRLDIHLNNLFPVDKPIMEPSAHQLATRRKKHRKLFFADELLVRNGEGRKECILNCSSCSSSSCAEESDYEYYTTSSVDEEETLKKSTRKEKECKEGLTISNTSRVMSHNVSTTSSTSTDSESESSSEDERENVDNDDVKPAATMTTEATSWHNAQLSSENNGLLPSFNALSADCPSRAALVVKDEGIVGGGGDGEVDMLQQSNSLPNMNCDDYNNFYNNNNNNTLNVIKYNLVNNTNFKKKQNNNNCSDDGDAAAAAADNSSEANKLKSSALVVDDIKHNGTVAHNEYRTGIRTISNNDISTIENNDVNDSSLIRAHQFKEWHQVLQLRSYNNELLTVLPYVLLE